MVATRKTNPTQCSSTPTSSARRAGWGHRDTTLGLSLPQCQIRLLCPRAVAHFGGLHRPDGLRRQTATSRASRGRYG